MRADDVVGGGCGGPDHDGEGDGLVVAAQVEIESKTLKQFMIFQF
jgi:hypothetical protein